MGLGALQPMHLIIVLVIILLVFGPGKLPELGRAVGDGMRELKRATNGETDTRAKQLEPIETMGPNCPRCQAPQSASARYCGLCGAAMETAAQSHAVL